MLDAMRQTLIASQCKTFEHKFIHAESYETLTHREAFYLATVGGAKVLGMDKVVGNFMPGKKLDCLVVDCQTEGGSFRHHTLSVYFLHRSNCILFR